MPYKDKEFARTFNREYQRDRRRKNPELEKDAYKRLKEQNPDLIRDRQLKRLYGISLVEWTAMFTAQGFTCAICSTDEKGKYDWHTDHDHETGKVRGIVCTHCNRLLGAAKDDTRVLESAIAYLMRSKD